MSPTLWLPPPVARSASELEHLGGELVAHHHVAAEVHHRRGGHAVAGGASRLLGQLDQQIAVRQGVQVRAADATGERSHEQLAVAGPRFGDVVHHHLADRASRLPSWLSPCRRGEPGHLRHPRPSCPESCRCSIPSLAGDRAGRRTDRRRGGPAMFGNRKKAVNGVEKLSGISFFDGFSPDELHAGGRAGRRRRRRAGRGARRPGPRRPGVLRHPRGQRQRLRVRRARRHVGSRLDGGRDGAGRAQAPQRDGRGRQRR